MDIYSWFLIAGIALVIWCFIYGYYLGGPKKATLKQDPRMRNDKRKNLEKNLVRKYNKPFRDKEDD